MASTSQAVEDKGQRHRHRNVAGTHRSGQLDLDHLRGRSGYAMPVQFAEIALRRELAETREGALRLQSRRVTRGADGDVTMVVFDVAGAAWEVRVRSAPGADLWQLTCKATRENPVSHKAHVLVDAAALAPGKYPFMGEFHAATAQGVVIAE